MQHLRYWLVGAVALLLLIACLGYYWAWGGFRPLLISQEQLGQIQICGKELQGAFLDAQIGQLMQQVHADLEAGKLQGELVLLLIGDTQVREEVTAFAGVITTANSCPSGYQTRSFDFPLTVRATVRAYPSVAPNPDQVRDRLEAYASQSGLELDTLTIDRYPAPDSIITEVPVRQ